MSERLVIYRALFGESHGGLQWKSFIDTIKMKSVRRFTTIPLLSSLGIQGGVQAYRGISFNVIGATWDDKPFLCNTERDVAAATKTKRRGEILSSDQAIRSTSICGPIELKFGGVQAYRRISFNVIGATWETRTVNNLPVLNPESKVRVGKGFILVSLINGDTVTLAIDVVNLYVVAFSGANNKSYFFKDVTALQYSNLFVGTQKTNLTFTGNYVSLEDRSGKERNSLPLGPTPLADAIIRLWNGRSVAEPLLVVIQMVSEAARFQYIEVQVGKSIANQTMFTPKGLITSMENKWSKMSKQIQLSADREHFIKSVQLKNDNDEPLIVNNFTTLWRYTMVAILLDKNVTTNSSSNSNIALAEDYHNNKLRKL
ncbi:nigrin b-like [Camellia sinensis]|uniref:nigrin b-like n=1 Tax=Camellia sinensis TaxID=4442 RepID=UPI0010356084|nr:nigrin b-like [Camellia sinensis]